MNNLLVEAFEKASQLCEEDQERLARLLLDEMESGRQREGSNGLTRNSSELAQEERASVTSRALWAMARGTLAVTDFAILQFMRTRTGERTIQPTQRRSYPQGTKRTLFERQNRQCVICGKRRTIKNFQIDHIVPASRGGPDNVTNFQLLCPPCNQRKGIHTNQEFYERYKRVVSGNLLDSPPAPPPQEITQKALRRNPENVDTRFGSTVQENQVHILQHEDQEWELNQRCRNRRRVVLGMAASLPPRRRLGSECGIVRRNYHWHGSLHRDNLEGQTHGDVRFVTGGFNRECQRSTGGLGQRKHLDPVYQSESDPTLISSLLNFSLRLKWNRNLALAKK